MKLNWVIEFFDGKKLLDGKDHFDMVNKHLIEKIYFTDNENIYGFHVQNGNFFINNILYDFKINIDNYLMTPFQSKTVKSIILPNDIDESIHSWNIGYKLNLVDKSSLFEYKMSIYNNGEIYFIAQNYSQDRILNKIKELRLR